MNEKQNLECPNPECRNSMDNFIRKINTVLFGPDEQSGTLGRIRKLELCIKSKISRGWLIGTAISVVGILCIVFIPMITGAIKTIGEISKSNIQLEVRVDANEATITRLEELIGESEARIKEHIDLVIKAHAAGASKKPDTAQGKYDR